jgi:uncharacterized protein
MIKKFFLLLIKGYKKGISPLLGNNCRFYPTCSMYTYEAIEIHGIFKGIWLGLKRLLRCHPFHPGGYDPVPGSKSNETISNKTSNNTNSSKNKDTPGKCHTCHQTDQSHLKAYLKSNKEPKYEKKNTIITNQNAIMKVSNEVK